MSFIVFPRVSVQGVKSLGSHFTCLCRGFEFYEVRKIVIVFQKENGNTFTLLIIFIVKSLQKEQKAQIYNYDPPICRNKHAITSKWFNSLDTNSKSQWSVQPSILSWTLVFAKLLQRYFDKFFCFTLECGIFLAKFCLFSVKTCFSIFQKICQFNILGFFNLKRRSSGLAHFMENQRSQSEKKNLRLRHLYNCHSFKYNKIV